MGYMQSNMAYIHQHDIHQLNYFFDKNLQLDEGVVVVVGLDHIVGHMFVEVVELAGVVVVGQVVHNVVEEQLVVLVEHIVEHQEQEAVVEHMFVGAVVEGVVEGDHMLVGGLEKIVVVVEVVEHILVDKQVVAVVAVGVVEVEHIQAVGVDRWVERVLQQQYIALLHLWVRQALQVVVEIVVEHHIRLQMQQQKLQKVQ